MNDERDITLTARVSALPERDVYKRQIISDRMDQFKKQYESIKAPEDLIMKANKEIKKSKAKRGFKTGIGAAAAFVVAVGVVANVSPSFAYAMSCLLYTSRCV